MARLHIEFEYEKRCYHLHDVICGKINFLLVRIKIKHMELAVITMFNRTLGLITGINEMKCSLFFINPKVATLISRSSLRRSRWRRGGSPATPEQLHFMNHEILTLSVDYFF